MKPWIAGLYCVVVALVPASTFAQDEKKPKAEPAAQVKAASSRVEPRGSRSHKDARECLDRGSIVAITKCAEKFL